MTGMVFIVLMINGQLTTLPEPYPWAQCEALIKDFGGRCVPVPDPNMNAKGCINTSRSLVCPNPKGIE